MPVLEANADLPQQIANLRAASEDLQRQLLTQAGVSSDVQAQLDALPDLFLPSGANQISSQQFVRGAVDGRAIAQDAVDTYNLINDAVTSAIIAPGAVGTTQIARAAVGVAQIGVAAIRTAAIRDLAVVSAKIESVDAGLINAGTINVALTLNAATINGGTITGGTIDIGGADDTSFHVDDIGQLWLGDAAYANAPFRVASDGSLRVGSGTSDYMAVDSSDGDMGFVSGGTTWLAIYNDAGTFSEPYMHYFGDGGVPAFAAGRSSNGDLQMGGFGFNRNTDGGVPTTTYYNPALFWGSVNNGTGIGSNDDLMVADFEDDLVRWRVTNTYLRATSPTLWFQEDATAKARVYWDGGSDIFVLRTEDADPIYFQTDATTRWRITATGTLRPESNEAVDIGTSSFRPSATYLHDLYCNGVPFLTALGTGVYNTLSINTAAGGNQWRVYRTSSSARYKFDLEAATDGHLANVRALRPTMYRWLEDPDKHDLGLIAEEVAEVLPMAALPDPEGGVGDFQDRALLATLVGAIQDLDAQLAEIRTLVDANGPDGR